MKVTCSCGRSYWPNQAWIHERCAVVATPVSRVATSVTESVATHVATRRESSAGGEVERVQEWREKNRERYNERMREYRRKRREQARAGFQKEVT